MARFERAATRDEPPARMRGAAGPLSRTTPMPPRPGGVAMATIVSVVENIGLSVRDRHSSGIRVDPADCDLLPCGDEDGLRKRVADAFRRHAGNFRDGQVDDPALVRIQRPELLIEPGLLAPSRRAASPSAAARRPCLCGSPARRRRRAARRRAAAERHVDDVLQRLERLAAMAHEQLGLVARRDSGAGRRPSLRRRPSASKPSAGEAVEEVDDRSRRVCHAHDSPRRRCRSCRRPHVSRGARPAAGPSGCSADRSGSSSAYCWPMPQTLLMSQ